MEALWNNGSNADWRDALSRYYIGINADLENRMEELLPSEIEHMSAQEFYDFLYNEYFLWKFNTPNRLATSRAYLERYVAEGLTSLNQIKHLIISAYELDPDGTKVLLTLTTLIHGLGTAGASGFLSIMYPTHYGTVDQRVVQALNSIHSLPQHDRIARMMRHRDSLSISEAIILEDIMRQKADELNRRFGTDEWTPRKIDMVLYSMGRLMN